MTQKIIMRRSPQLGHKMLGRQKLNLNSGLPITSSTIFSNGLGESFLWSGAIGTNGRYEITE